jgi:hypothetical protein
MVRMKLYIEGGGESKALHIECRRGFRAPLERAGFAGRMPSTVACGSRNDALGDFATAVAHVKGGEYPVLLVDSEGPVTQSPWVHLQARDGWARPRATDDDQVQLMVQCMETWCVADRPTLRVFFGSCLQERSLPTLSDLEAQPKDDVQAALVGATRQCGRDRAYRKGRRSFELLGRLDPDELRQRLPHFARLCEMLDRRLSSE